MTVAGITILNQNLLGVIFLNKIIHSLIIVLIAISLINSTALAINPMPIIVPYIASSSDSNSNVKSEQNIAGTNISDNIKTKEIQHLLSRAVIEDYAFDDRKLQISLFLDHNIIYRYEFADRENYNLIKTAIIKKQCDLDKAGRIAGYVILTIFIAFAIWMIGVAVYDFYY